MAVLKVYTMTIPLETDTMIMQNLERLRQHLYFTIQHLFQLHAKAQTWKVLSNHNSPNTEGHNLLQAYKGDFKINGKSNRPKEVQQRKHTSL